MESHERLKSGFMVNDFASKEIFYENILFQRHPLFFERTTSLVTMEEKTGAEVRPSGWYNLGAILVSHFQQKIQTVKIFQESLNGAQYVIFHNGG